jgi:hypothetical protein
LDELFPAQIRGPAPKDQLIVLDGKEPKHGSGASVLSAVTVPSQHYLGSAVVDQKTNEIPVARELFKRLELEDRTVSLHALHTQDETARAGLGTLGPIYPLHAMARIQATPKPFHHNRFPIGLVRRPPPSGTPPGIEQISNLKQLS